MKGLCYIRKRLGLTQAEFGERVGIDPNTISRYERKQLNATNKTAMKIAQKLCVSIDELMNGPAEETREFTLIYDREGDLRMEVLNMAANAPEQRVMSVSPQRIAAMVNIKTANLNREEAKKLMLDEMAARFDEAWAQQEKWKGAGA